MPLDEANRRFLAAVRAAQGYPVHPDLPKRYPNKSLPGVIRKRTAGLLEIARQFNHPFKVADIAPLAEELWGLSRSSSEQYARAILVNAGLQKWISYRHDFFYMGPVKAITIYRRHMKAARNQGARSIRRVDVQNPFKREHWPHVHRQWEEGRRAALEGRIGLRPMKKGWEVKAYTRKMRDGSVVPVSGHRRAQKKGPGQAEA